MATFPDKLTHIYAYRVVKTNQSFKLFSYFKTSESFTIKLARVDTNSQNIKVEFDYDIVTFGACLY